MSNPAPTNDAGTAGDRLASFPHVVHNVAAGGPDRNAARFSHELRWELVERLARLRFETRLGQPPGIMAVMTRPNLPAGPPARRRR